MNALDLSMSDQIKKKKDRTRLYRTLDITNSRYIEPTFVSLKGSIYPLYYMTKFELIYFLPFDVQSYFASLPLSVEFKAIISIFAQYRNNPDFVLSISSIFWTSVSLILWIESEKDLIQTGEPMHEIRRKAVIAN